MGIHELKQNLSLIIRQTLEKYYGSNGISNKLLWFADEGIEEANPDDPLKRLKGQYVINFTAEDINNREVAFEARCNENKSSYSCDLLKEYNKYRNAGCYNSPGFTVLDHTDTHIDFGKDAFEEDIEWVDTPDADAVDAADKADHEISYDAEVCEDTPDELPLEVTEAEIADAEPAEEVIPEAEIADTAPEEIEDILEEEMSIPEAEVALPDAEEAKEITDAEEDGDVALEDALPDVTLDAPQDEATEDAGQPPIILGPAFCTTKEMNTCLAQNAQWESSCMFFETFKIQGNVSLDPETDIKLEYFLDLLNAPIVVELSGDNTLPNDITGVELEFWPTEDFIPGMIGTLSAEMFGNQVAQISGNIFDGIIMLRSDGIYNFKKCVRQHYNPCMGKIEGLPEEQQELECKQE